MWQNKATLDFQRFRREAAVYNHLCGSEIFEDKAKLALLLQGSSHIELLIPKEYPMAAPTASLLGHGLQHLHVERVHRSGATCWPICLAILRQGTFVRQSARRSAQLVPRMVDACCLHTATPAAPGRNMLVPGQHFLTAGALRRSVRQPSILLPCRARKKCATFVVGLDFAVQTSP